MKSLFLSTIIDFHDEVDSSIEAWTVPIHYGCRQINEWVRKLPQTELQNGDLGRAAAAQG